VGLIKLGDSKIDITGYFCPFYEHQPIVVELPGIAGVYVPVFKDRGDMVDACRYLKIWKYQVTIISNGIEFVNWIKQADPHVVVNPKAYNGRCVWDALLPDVNEIPLIEKSLIT